MESSYFQKTFIFPELNKTRKNWAQQDVKELVLLTSILLPYENVHAFNPYFHSVFWTE